MKIRMFLLTIFSMTGYLTAQDAVVSKSAFSNGEGVNGRVAAMIVQSDGKIVIAGNFTSVNGVPRSNLARLNSDGTLDTAFANSPVAGVSGPVEALALAEDGSIYVGGTFNQAGGVATSGLARYLPDGSVDRDFAKNLEPGINGTVLALALQADGKIIAGGNFTSVAGKPEKNIARVNPDGSPTAPIPTQGQLNGQVDSLTLFGDKKTLAGGSFRVTNQEAQSLFLVK
ncbi:MAG: delta-60 repeat domain-containing protein [Terrimicrobiaceae bacterium]